MLALVIGELALFVEGAALVVRWEQIDDAADEVQSGRFSQLAAAGHAQRSSSAQPLRNNQ